MGLTPAGSVKIELNPRTPAGVGQLENHWMMWKIHSYCPKCCEWRKSFASRVDSDANLGGSRIRFKKHERAGGGGSWEEGGAGGLRHISG